MPRALLFSLVLVACGAAARRPQVNVLGVARTRLVVEIHNPTEYTIDMASFEWTLVADGVPAESGSLPLRRAVVPHGSVIVELPIRSRPTGDYRLEGRLRAQDRASWRVSVTGRFQ